MHLKYQGKSTRQGSSDSHGDKSNPKPPVIGLHAVSSRPVPKRKVILALVRVKLVGSRGDITEARALLDQGSEASLVSESIVQLLGLPKERTFVPLSGLGASAAGVAHSMTSLVVNSCIESDFELRTDALILPQLTSQLLAESIIDLDLQLFSGLTLAEPQFCVPDKIDIILGADVYGQLIRMGLRRFPSSQLIAQNSAFGWVVSGTLESETPRRAEQSTTSMPLRVMHCASIHELDKTLQRFWILEELSATRRVDTKFACR